MSFARQARPAHATLSEIGQVDKPLPMAKTLISGLIKAGFSDDDGNVGNECFHWGSGKRLLQTQTDPQQLNAFLARTGGFYIEGDSVKS